MVWSAQHHLPPENSVFIDVHITRLIYCSGQFNRFELKEVLWLDALRFTNSPVEAVGNGARGSLFFKGKFYDNLFTRRRGATALTWRKPKIKFDFKGSVFEYKKNRFVEEFNLQSFFLEKGENSYMREPVALQIMREAGVPASEAMHMTVNQNGEYYGLFAFIEQMDDNFLVVSDYPVYPLKTKATS